MSFDVNAWQNTKVDDQGDNPGPPDVGEYVIELTDASFFVSKAGNPIIKLVARVSEGEEAGYEWTEIRGMGTEGQLKAAKATCARLGIDVEQIDSEQALDDELRACIGRYYDINVAQNGDYRNVYFNGRATSVEPPEEGWREQVATASTVAPADDDIPF